MINSKEDLMGVLNLTIDNTPIIPNDNPRFPAIVHAITVIAGAIIKEIIF